MRDSLGNDKRCGLAAYELALNNGAASINIYPGFLSAFPRDWKTPGRLQEKWLGNDR